MKRIETLRKEARKHLAANEYRSGDHNGVSGMEIARALDKLREAEVTLRHAFGGDVNGN